MNSHEERGCISTGVKRAMFARHVHTLVCIPVAEQGIINKQRQRLDGLIEETTKAPRRLQSKVWCRPSVWRLSRLLGLGIHHRITAYVLYPNSISAR